MKFKIGQFVTPILETDGKYILEIVDIKENSYYIKNYLNQVMKVQNNDSFDNFFKTTAKLEIVKSEDIKRVQENGIKTKEDFLLKLKYDLELIGVFGNEYSKNKAKEILQYAGKKLL